MLFRRKNLQAIKAGEVTLAFRRWTKPSVKTGGTQQTQLGQLTIKNVSVVSLSSITLDDARLAGFDSVRSLKKELQKKETGDVYRIELGGLREDPRIALRNRPPDESELSELEAKLMAMDARSAAPWTRQYLDVFSVNEAVRAADLCIQVNFEKAAFKLNVRKLKALGLTESLGTGYRLAPRGRAVLKKLKRK